MRVEITYRLTTYGKVHSSVLKKVVTVPDRFQLGVDNSQLLPDEAPNIVELLSAEKYKPKTLGELQKEIEDIESNIRRLYHITPNRFQNTSMLFRNQVVKVYEDAIKAEKLELERYKVKIAAIDELLRD